MATFNPSDLLFECSDFNGRWERDGSTAQFFLRSVHVLETRDLNDFETVVSVVDARTVEIPDVLVSRDDVERIFFWLTLDIARLARPDRAGFWREGELRKLLGATASSLFSRGSFEIAMMDRHVAWPGAWGEEPRSVRDFPSGLPGLGKRR